MKYKTHKYHNPLSGYKKLFRINSPKLSSFLIEKTIVDITIQEKYGNRRELNLLLINFNDKFSSLYVKYPLIKTNNGI